MRRQLVQLGWEVIEDAPKSEAGGRTIALDAGSVAALRTHRRAQLVKRLEWGSAWVNLGKVFTRENGEPCTPPGSLTGSTPSLPPRICPRSGFTIYATARRR